MASSTLNQAVTGIVSGLGASTQSATSLYNTYTSNVNSLQAQRQAEDGVSTDEEVSNMISYQKAYEAAAKVICAAAARVQADALVIGRGSAAGLFGRLRTNAYAIIRQAPCPVVSV